MKRILSFLIAFLSTHALHGADIVSFDADNALMISTEEYVRTFNVPTNWNTLRVGVRLTTTNITTSIANTEFVIGLSSGTNSYKQASPAHFVGVQYAENGAIRTNGTLTYGNASFPIYMSKIPTNFWMGKIVAGTITLATNGTRDYNSYVYIGGGNDSNYTSAVYVDFIKGTPWTVKSWQLSDTYDISAGRHTTNMTAVTPTANGSVPLKYGQMQLTVDQATDGYLDTVNIWFSPTNKFLRIHDIQVARPN